MVKHFLLFVTFLLTLSCIKDKPEGADLSVGDILPDFQVTMSDGSTVSDESLKHGVSLVMFFHTTCPDCQKVLPVMQSLYDAYLERGVRFAVISREEGKESVEKYWNETGLTMQYSAQETRDIYSKFAQSRVPRIYIYDKGGVIKYIHTDDPLPEFQELDQQINSVCGTDK
jgi:peroxiredoxin